MRDVILCYNSIRFSRDDIIELQRLRIEPFYGRPSRCLRRRGLVRRDTTTGRWLPSPNGNRAIEAMEDGRVEVAA